MGATVKNTHGPSRLTSNRLTGGETSASKARYWGPGPLFGPLAPKHGQNTGRSTAAQGNHTAPLRTHRRPSKPRPPSSASPLSCSCVNKHPAALHNSPQPVKPVMRACITAARCTALRPTGPMPAPSRNAAEPQTEPSSPPTSCSDVLTRSRRPQPCWTAPLFGRSFLPLPLYPSTLFPEGLRACHYCPACAALSSSLVRP